MVSINSPDHSGTYTYEGWKSFSIGDNFKDQGKYGQATSFLKVTFVDSKGNELIQFRGVADVRTVSELKRWTQDRIRILVEMQHLSLPDDQTELEDGVTLSAVCNTPATDLMLVLAPLPEAFVTVEVKNKISGQCVYGQVLNQDTTIADLRHRSLGNESASFWVGDHKLHEEDPLRNVVEFVRPSYGPLPKLEVEFVRLRSYDSAISDPPPATVYELFKCIYGPHEVDKARSCLAGKGVGVESVEDLKMFLARTPNPVEFLRGLHSQEIEYNGSMIRQSDQSTTQQHQQLIDYVRDLPTHA